MAKTVQSSYNELITNIRKREFAPVYFLMGEEPYFIDSVTDLLQNYVIPEDERDFNLSTFYGNDSSIDAVINASRRFPVMSDRQMVILKEVQTLHDAKNQLEKLDSYLQHPVKSTILVVIFKGDTVKQTSKFVKSIIKCGGVVFESSKVKEWQLDPIINDYCSSRKIRIDNKSVAMLKEFIGTDLKRLFGEIDKLVVASGTNSIITPELIERNIGWSKDFNNFELVKSIAYKNYEKAIKIIDYFERNPKQNPTIVTAIVLFNYFSNLLLAHYSQDKSDNGLMQQLRLKSSYSLNDIRPGLSNFSARKCINIIKHIRDFDCKSKGIGSMQKEYPLLKELMYNIFTA